MLSKIKQLLGGKKPRVGSEFNRLQDQRLIAGGYWGYRPFQMNQTGNLEKEVSQLEWKTIVSASNRLFWNFGPVQGGIESKATFAIGRSWEPIVQGEDKEWGRQAERWLSEVFYPASHVSGIDFKTALYLECLAIDRDGDCLTIYTESESGFPQFQQVPWYSIGHRDQSSVIESGPYKGLAHHKGVIVNDVGRPVAYCVMGATAEQDQYISARSADYLAEPRTVNQGRGMPAFTAAILDLRDLTTTQGYIKQAMLIASSIGLIEHNEMGMADPLDAAMALSDSIPTGTPGVMAETFMGGMVRYFKANSGAKLEQLKNEIPSDSTERLMERLMRNALLGAGMPPEFYWKPEGSGANVRMVVTQVNRTVADRQDLMKQVAKRRIGYAISKAIKLGMLPKYKGSDQGGFLRWGFSMPPILTADAGYAGQDAREAYKLGMRTLTDILGEQGKSLEQHLDEREREEVAIRERMNRSGLPESSFRILTPNGNPPDQQQSDEVKP